MNDIRPIWHPITCTSSNIIYVIQCSKCRMQNISETKQHLSNRFGEHRWATEKAINHCHIGQPPAVSDHFILQASRLQHKTHSPRTNKLSRRHHSQSQRSCLNYHQQYSWTPWNEQTPQNSICFYLYIFYNYFNSFCTYFSIVHVSSF